MKEANVLNQPKAPSSPPIKLLQDLAERKVSGCLSVSHNTVDWKFYFHQGLLTYASHSLDPFERLERHLRRLSQEVPTITTTARTQARLRFEGKTYTKETYPPEYQAIAWLVSENYLNSEAAATLIKRLMHEVAETYLLLKDSQCNFTKGVSGAIYFGYPDPMLLVQEVEKTNKYWEALVPIISSPYQRPYLYNRGKTEPLLSLQQHQKLSKLLKGFSFRQIAILVKQDELKIARYFYQLIQQKIVMLQSPQHPFDLLPKFQPVAPQERDLHEPELGYSSLGNGDLPDTPTPSDRQKIVCVDDSPTILSEINRFLEDHNLSVHALADSSKALMEIMRIKPDMILLDVGMPAIDGYKLCRMIRNHPLFKDTPIVMVTGHTGLIDRAKARISGATDYLTKPFSQPELVKMVFRYLT